MIDSHNEYPSLSELSQLFYRLPPAKRSAAFCHCFSFSPDNPVDPHFALGRVRVLLADVWEQMTATPVPIAALREEMTAPLPVETSLLLSRLNAADSPIATAAVIAELVSHMQRRVAARTKEQQLRLFDAPETPVSASNGLQFSVSDVVSNLSELVQADRRFSTIYADPPWQYDNRGSRAAAENHYRTMTIKEICAEPVADLVAANAHLHLWVPSGFLREAFDVIEAWGFDYKSCFVWAKDKMGLGNYWRLSHELLLLGVRGKLTFGDRSQRSWMQLNRNEHSRKPGAVRMLIEKVSPGPYLEMYARAELPHSAWTVYGNRVERRMF